METAQSAQSIRRKKMSRNIYCLYFLVIVEVIFVNCCLITNCPRGGKRGGKFGSIEATVKPCVPCGPRNSGQCFGPSICCGPFGCLISTPETIKCQREGYFNEREPCIAGTAPCRRNTGRCAMDGICCSQESCHTDKQCSIEEKTKPLSDNLLGLDIYNLLNYPAEMNMDK